MTGAKYGPETATVEAFLRHLKAMTPDQRSAAVSAAQSAARSAAGHVARDAARSAAWYAAWDAAWDAAGYGAGYGARAAAGYAANEIQNAALLRERGQPFYFLPMFGFATPEDIK